MIYKKKQKQCKLKKKLCERVILILSLKDIVQKKRKKRSKHPKVIGIIIFYYRVKLIILMCKKIKMTNLTLINL